MARTSLQDMSGLPDPFLSHNWDIIIPNIPGGGNSGVLTIKAANAVIPGITLDVIPVTLHGITLNYAGMERYGQQLPVSYLETRDLGTRTQMRNWMEFARNTRQNSGVEKSAYATTANLVLYDDVPIIVRTVTAYNIWPAAMDEVQLEGTGASQAIFVRIGFVFDYHTEA